MSSSLLRCESCKGQKKIIKLGMMLEKCSLCDGIGFIEKPISSIENITDEICDENKVIILTSKRGRPKKVI